MDTNGKKQQETIQNCMDDIIYRIEEWDDARESGYDAGYLSVWLDPSWRCEDCGEGLDDVGRPHEEHCAMCYECYDWRIRTWSKNY